MSFGDCRPRMLMCYLCGREYGSRSLKIHTPQSKKAWLAAEAQKPKKDQRSLPEPPKAEEPIKGMSNADVDKFNEEAYENWSEKVLERCKFCDRTFNTEALARHNKSCTAANPARRITKKPPPAATAATAAAAAGAESGASSAASSPVVPAKQPEAVCGSHEAVESVVRHFGAACRRRPNGLIVAGHFTMSASIALEEASTSALTL
ncbi:hypothetical protein CYMTET_18945 [Cymbomonas tetramitiformis]|uniref:Uncharacterized protein n=1 Tax=Cymbomonas tetramitiformis TaxID=36881 RepID=A0AAE0L5N9_9CHLO|nr:hypothetical protein CYMTET_18945 [Cymbomonas tetramitiformis]